MKAKESIGSSTAAEVITKGTIAEAKPEPKKAASAGTKKTAKSEQKAANEAAAVKETVKTETKAEEKPAASVEAAQAAPEKKTTRKTTEKKTESKTTARKTAAPKKTVKKTATRKAVASKAEPAMELYVQYHGKQIDEKALLERVIQDCSEQKIKVEDIKLYVKPEDNACYYVANGNVAGKVDLY